MGRLRYTIAAREDPFIHINAANGSYEITRYKSIDDLASAPPGITAIELDPEGGTGIREPGVNLDQGPYLILRDKIPGAEEAFARMERQSRDEVERQKPQVGSEELLLFRYFKS